MILCGTVGLAQRLGRLGARRSWRFVRNNPESGDYGVDTDVDYVF